MHCWESTIKSNWIWLWYQIALWLYWSDLQEMRAEKDRRRSLSHCQNFDSWFLQDLRLLSFCTPGNISWMLLDRLLLTVLQPLYEPTRPFKFVNNWKWRGKL